jgi:hypothetical protein
MQKQARQYTQAKLARIWKNPYESSRYTFFFDEHKSNTYD